MKNCVLKVVISGWVQWLYRWLSESKVMVHRGHMGASVVSVLVEGGYRLKGVNCNNSEITFGES